jgi:thymidylate kinase
LESERDDFFDRVSASYLELAAADAVRIRTIDGSASPDEVRQAALDALADLL